MKNVIVKILTEATIEQMGIKNWPIWEKEVSRFDWEYDGDEECLLLEGEVDVETQEGTITIKSGDFVVFRKGLRCVWDVKKSIRKHYNFPQQT